MYASSAINLRGHQGPQERRNAIINGDFNICQRGEFNAYQFGFGETTLGSTFEYTADRWRYFAVGTTIGVQPEVVVSRKQHDIDGPKGFNPTSNHYLRVQTSGTGSSLSALYGPATFANGETTEAFLEQRIENVKTLAGKSATLSFKSRFTTVSGSSRVISSALVQVFGTGASNHDVDVPLSGATFQLGSDWAKYSHTFSVPDLAGKTLGDVGTETPTGYGNTASSYLAARFYLQTGTAGDATSDILGWNTGATEAIDFSQVQLEAGEQSTDFEQRSIGDEIRDCKRYFETIRGFVVTNGVIAVDSDVSELIKMDEKRNNFWVARQIYGDWSSADPNRGISILHKEVDGFVIQITKTGVVGTLVENLSTGHNPNGGRPGSSKPNNVSGRIWVTVDSEL